MTEVQKQYNMVANEMEKRKEVNRVLDLLTQA
jgi:hypothetical protein